MEILHLVWNVQLVTSMYGTLAKRSSDLVHRRLGIRGSFFCGQECFKAGCEHYISRVHTKVK